MHCKVGTAPSTGRASSTRSPSAREPPQIAWCFCSLADKVLSGAHACADFSLRTLAGDTSSGNKGHVDAFIFRLSLIHHMGHVLLERLEPSPQTRKKYGDVSRTRRIGLP